MVDRQTQGSWDSMGTEPRGLRVARNETYLDDLSPSVRGTIDAPRFQWFRGLVELEPSHRRERGRAKYDQSHTHIRAHGLLAFNELRSGISDLDVDTATLKQ